MPGPTPTKISSIPKAQPGQPAVAKTAAPREKVTEKMWRDMESNGKNAENFTGFIAEPETMSIIAFVLVLLPTAFLLDLLNFFDLTVVGAVVPYITDFTLGLALSFGLWLAGNKDPMQLAIAGLSLLVCLFPALRDFFPWTIAVCAGFIISLPFVQRAMGRTLEFAGNVTGTVQELQQAAETATKIAKQASKASKLIRANG